MNRLINVYQPNLWNYLHDKCKNLKNRFKTPFKTSSISERHKRIFVPDDIIFTTKLNFRSTICPAFEKNWKHLQCVPLSRKHHLPYFFRELKNNRTKVDYILINFVSFLIPKTFTIRFTKSSVSKGIYTQKHHFLLPCLNQTSQII